MRSPSVVVAYHHWGLVTGKFAWCLARAVAHEGNKLARVIEFGSPYTDEARNRIVDMFLDVNIIPQPEYLLMVDADIEFEKDSVSKTMWVAQNFDADVVWGVYALGSFTNSVYKKDANSDFGVALDDLKPNMIYEGIYCGGTGWCLMKRSFLMKMKEHYPGPWHWFARDEVPGAGGKMVKLGEDVGFGRRVFLLGGKQIAYTGNALIHHKLHATVPQFMAPILEELGTPISHNNAPKPTDIRGEDGKPPLGAHVTTT